jgi:hypothetical protein
MNRVACFCLFVCTLVVCCSSLGCKGGRVEEPTYSVTGVVTVGGAPLKDGLINFESEVSDGQPPGSGIITDGNYTVKSRAGKKKVVITSEKPTGEKDSTGQPITQNWIPAEYSSKTKLTAEISATTPNKFDFPLKK